MKLAALVGASLLVAGSALAQGTAPVLDVSRPVTLKLVDARLDEAIATVGRLAGISIQWDASVSAAARLQVVAPVPISFQNAPADEVLGALTRRVGLAVVVVNAKTVRVAVASARQP